MILFSTPANCDAREKIRRGLDSLTSQQVRALCGTAVVRPRVAQVCAPKPLCLVSRQDTASLQRFLQKRARRITMAAHLTDVLRIVIACLRYHRVTRMRATQVVAMLRDPERTRMQDADTQAWGPDKLTGVSAATAKRQLAALVEAGKLVRVGRYLTTPRLANVAAERAEVAAELSDAACHRRARRAVAERNRRRRVAPPGAVVSQRGPRICSQVAITPTADAQPPGMDLIIQGYSTPTPALPKPMPRGGVDCPAPVAPGAAGSPCRPPDASATRSSDPDPQGKSAGASATDAAVADAGCMPADHRTRDLQPLRNATAAALTAMHQAPPAAPPAQAPADPDDEAVLAEMSPAMAEVMRRVRRTLAGRGAQEAEPRASAPPSPCAPPAAAQRPPPPALPPREPPPQCRPNRCTTAQAKSVLETFGLWNQVHPKLGVVLRGGATHADLLAACQRWHALREGGSAVRTNVVTYLQEVCAGIMADDGRG